jgi:hypothetical protein
MVSLSASESSSE